MQTRKMKAVKMNPTMIHGGIPDVSTSRVAATTRELRILLCRRLASCRFSLLCNSCCLRMTMESVMSVFGPTSNWTSVWSESCDVSALLTKFRVWGPTSIAPATAALTSSHTSCASATSTTTTMWTASLYSSGIDALQIFPLSIGAYPDLHSQVKSSVPTVLQAPPMPHVWVPVLQGSPQGGQDPPQSTRVSSPFLIRSVQVVVLARASTSPWLNETVVFVAEPSG
mmetsp:Transcript_99576/g.167930  ORF Transcript_99576/g.167930 Transcript_99576/m.167930 type:complete len:226 (-) Transcript_99576:721-1398(-)